MVLLQPLGINSMTLLLEVVLLDSFECNINIFFHLWCMFDGTLKRLFSVCSYLMLLPAYPAQN